MAKTTQVLARHSVGFSSLLLAAALSVVVPTTDVAAEQYRHDTVEVMVITASGTEQSVDEAPASISVVSRHELLRNEVASLADALRGIQGVNVNTSDARDGKTGNQSVSLRGLPRDYTLVMI